MPAPRKARSEQLVQVANRRVTRAARSALTADEAARVGRMGLTSVNDFSEIRAVLQYQVERTAREWLAADAAARSARPRLAFDDAGFEKRAIADTGKQELVNTIADERFSSSSANVLTPNGRSNKGVRSRKPAVRLSDELPNSDE